MRYLPLILAAAPNFALAEPLRIVTDIPAVQSLVSQVAGDRADVSVLLGANADPHNFQLRPSQSREISNADALIWVGEELTPWLARARDGIAADIISIELLGIINGEDNDDHHGHESEEDHAVEGDHDEDHQDEHDDHSGEVDDHGHDHDGIDPHIWLGIHESEEMLHEIAEHLAEIDPEGTEVYEHNAHVAIERLEVIEDQITDLLEPVHEVPFVVGHDAYSYFVTEFNLNQVETLGDIHNSDASAKHISSLVHMAEHGEIACVFPEVGESDKLAKVLVEEGVRLGAPIDPAGSSPEHGPDLHGQLLLNLANDIAECLSS